MDFSKNSNTLKVVKSVFMGENHEYEVQSENEIIEIILSNPHGKEIKKVGEMLTFGIDEEAIHIL